MMGLLPFGMVTILLLTLVSFKANPLRLWSSNTNSPSSTWTGLGNQLSLGNWIPAGHVTTFESGVKVEKFQDGSLTDIHSSLNGQILNPTTIPKSYFLLQNNGNLVQTAYGLSTPIYNSKTAPVFAPIQLVDGTSTRCITATAPNLISFNDCLDRNSTQLWKHNSNSQVVNQGTGLCLDGAAGGSARSNTCDSRKASQKWSWVNGYLQVTVSRKTSCLKATGTAGTSSNSVIGVCTGPRMAWNK
jgi:hypothetical protein